MAKQERKRKRKSTTKGAPQGKNITGDEGVRDVFPQEGEVRDRLRKIAYDTAHSHGFLRIETSLLDPKEAISRAIGESTKTGDLYTVSVKRRSWVLRHSSFLSMARAYLAGTAKRKIGQPAKLFAEDILFPPPVEYGIGAWRTSLSFHIIGGPNDPIYDAQILLVVSQLLRAFRLQGAKVMVNSSGCKVCWAPYRKSLLAYYKKHAASLCGECRKGFAERLADTMQCRNDLCRELRREAPSFLDKICAPCSRHFQKVLEYLDDLGVEYELDNWLPALVPHGSKTAFAVKVPVGSGEVTVAVGGHYDYLFESLAKRLVPAVGGELDLERAVEAALSQQPQRSWSRRGVFIIYMGEVAKRRALKVKEVLRESGLHVGEAFGKELLHAQLKVAEKEHFPIALIIGLKETYDDSVILRDLKSGTQETISMERVFEEIKLRLKK